MTKSFFFPSDDSLPMAQEDSIMLITFENLSSSFAWTLVSMELFLPLFVGVANGLDPSRKSTNSSSISAPDSIRSLIKLAWLPRNLSTDEYWSIRVLTDSIASSPILVTLSYSVPSSERPGIDPIRFEIATRRSGFVACSLKRSLFSISLLTRERQLLSLLSNNICQIDFGVGIPIISSGVTSLPVLPSRRFTNLAAASISSMTKMTSFIPSFTGTDSPRMS
mmetsp:Transcript_877/g.1075  ORF Transcript_877/g.1075 Transcript_877/m.1075 type:complete len:222 (-) Transcript_877:3000-3665(-)